jgi:hypothetical protein
MQRERDIGALPAHPNISLTAGVFELPYGDRIAVLLEIGGGHFSGFTAARYGQ